MNYRLLPVSEWHKVEPMFNGDSMPSPLAGSIAVAEDGDEIKGVLVIQLALHMEPIIITDPHVNFLHLARVIEENLVEGTEYWTTPSSGKIEWMCESNDMAKFPRPLYRKQIGGN